jgi:FHA domain
MRALLQSLLVRQSLALKERFRARYPHPWLVWEPGVWNVSDGGEQNVATTQLPTEELRDCLPVGDDAMCFELLPAMGAGSLSVGRASHNQLVVNDATVSREHLVLRPGKAGDWTVELVAETGAASLEGESLRLGRPRPLASGASLQLGEVRMTFHSAADFARRVEQAAAQVMQSLGGGRPS